MRTNLLLAGTSLALLIAAGAALVSPAAAGSRRADKVEEAREESIERFEGLLDRYPDSEMRAPVLVLLGNLYIESEKSRYLAAVMRYEDGELPEAPVLDYSEALDVFTEIVDHYPGYEGRAEAFYAIGICREETGDSERAVEAYESAIRCAGEESAVRGLAAVRTADLRFQAGEWAEALGGYEKAAEWGIDAESHKIEYKTGWCHLKLDDLAEAGRLFRICADRAWEAGRGAKGREDLTEVLRSLALVQVDRAPSDVESFSKSFDDEGLRRAALVELGEVLLDQDRPANAETAYRAALAMDDRTADAPVLHDRIIECLTLRERKEDAGREMEAFASAYGAGSDWRAAWGGDADRLDDLMGRLRRNVWNAALIRYRRGGEEDLPVAASLFESYVDELNGDTGRDRARLFAAEAWYRSGHYDASLRDYALIDADNLEQGAERMAALRGAVLAARDGGVAAPRFAAAANRYADHYPGEEDAQKSLLLAAERLEGEGDLGGALALSDKVATLEPPLLAGEASLRAGRLHAKLSDHVAAEESFLEAAEWSDDEGDRTARLEKAAASSFLAARAREEAEDWPGASEAYGRTAERYGETAPGRDALRRRIVCAAHLEESGLARALADSLRDRMPGDTLSAAALRQSAALFVRVGHHDVAADLLVHSHEIESDPAVLFAAAGEYEKAGDAAEALRRYREVAGGYTDAAEAPRAAYRAALLLVDAGDDREGAEWFDRSLRYPAPPDRDVAEVRFREGEAHAGAGEADEAARSYERAIDAAGEPSGGDDEPSSASWYAARAHFARGGQIRPSLEEKIVAWRNGSDRRKPSALLNEYVAHLREGIAYRFAEITDPEIRNLAGILEMYGRTAHMREWERGNVPDAALVEPYFTDAEALLAGSGAGGGLYAALADTLIRSGAGEIDNRALPEGDEPVSPDRFERHSEALARWLGALDRADAKWRAAAELIRRQREVEPALADNLSREQFRLALRAADENRRGAQLLAASPPPPSLNEEEAGVYRDMLNEKARVYEDRAGLWMEMIEEATEEGIGPSLSQVSPSGDGRDEGR